MQTSSKPVVGFNDLKIKSQFLLQNNPQTVQPVVELTNTTTDLSNGLPHEDVPLTSERAEETVINFAEEKNKTGNKQLYATLISSKVSLSDTMITIEINNEVQKEILNTIKQDMLDAFRITLSNKQTQINIIVSEEQGEIKAYKPDDKFKMMAEKNPALLELKRRFDLNVEY